jgi:hypothetical protein
LEEIETGPIEQGKMDIKGTPCVQEKRARDVPFERGKVYKLEYGKQIPEINGMEKQTSLMSNNF